MPGLWRPHLGAGRDVRGLPEDSMSAAEPSGWVFPLADARETPRTPTADDRRLDDPEYRAELFVYDGSGAVELRCANGYLNSDVWRDLDEWR